MVSSCGGGGGDGATAVEPPINLPPVPQNVQASSGPGVDSIEVTWTHSNGASSHNIYWSENAIDDLTAATKVSNVTSPTIIDGLTTGAIYNFVVTAVNSSGESTRSSGVAAMPGLLGKVQIIEAVEDDAAITISWHSVNYADSYSLFWHETDDRTTINRVDNIVSPFTLAGLSNDLDHTLSISAVGPGGDGERSEMVHATPNPIPTGWTRQTVINGPLATSLQGFGASLRGASVNSSGVAAVIWDEDRNPTGSGALTTISHNSAGVWSDPILLEPDQPNEGGGADVTVTSNGEVHAAYAVALGTIWARRYTGGLWLDSERIDNGLAKVARYNPKLASDSQNNAFLVWHEADPTSFGLAERTVQLWASRFDSVTESWSQPVQIGQSPRNIQSLRLEVEPSGRAVAAWLQEIDPYDPNNPDALKRRIAYAAEYDGSNWNPATLIGRNDLGSFDSARELATDINSLGRVLVAWTQSRSSDGVTSFEELDSARFDPTTSSWSSPELITSTTIGRRISDIDVAIDDADQAIATWTPSFSGAAIAASIYNSGSATWEAPHNIYSTQINPRPVEAKVEKEVTGANVAVWSIGRNRLAVRRSVDGSSNWSDTGVLGIHAFRTLVFEMSASGHAIVAVDASYAYDGKSAHGILVNVYSP